VISFVAGTSSTVAGYVVTRHPGFHSLVDPWVNWVLGLFF
jgi:hypothetical protein